MSSSDTIAAISTAPGRGGVAVVRVSGPDAWAVAEKVTGRPASSGTTSMSPVGMFAFLLERSLTVPVIDSVDSLLTPARASIISSVSTTACVIP